MTLLTLIKTIYFLIFYVCYILFNQMIKIENPYSFQLGVTAIIILLIESLPT